MLNQCIKTELNTKIIYIIELFIIKVYLNKLLIIFIGLIKNILRKLWINSEKKFNGKYMKWTSKQNLKTLSFKY